MNTLEKAINIDNTLLEPARRIEILAKTDVLVIGGGPAGMSAALASARTGAKTIILERYGCLGGVLTTVGCEGYAWFRHKDTIEAGGIGREFEERIWTPLVMQEA